MDLDSYIEAEFDRYMEEMMGTPAQFIIVKHETDNQNLVIKDVGDHKHHKTITNDIEGVLKRVFPILGGRNFWYYDSDNEKTLVLYSHQNGQFQRFDPGHIRAVKKE